MVRRGLLHSSDHLINLDRVEEIETPQILDAWEKTLDIIEALNAEKIIPGHLEVGWEPKADEDMAHMRKYLQLVSEKVIHAKTKPQIKDLYETFKAAFPLADKNLEFFLGHMSNRFGEGGQAWEENRLHNIGERSKEQLEGYLFRL